MWQQINSENVYGIDHRINQWIDKDGSNEVSDESSSNLWWSHEGNN